MQIYANEPVGPGVQALFSHLKSSIVLIPHCLSGLFLPVCSPLQAWAEYAFHLIGEAAGTAQNWLGNWAMLRVDVWADCLCQGPLLREAGCTQAGVKCYVPDAGGLGLHSERNIRVQ